MKNKAYKDVKALDDLCIKKYEIVCETVNEYAYDAHFDCSGDVARFAREKLHMDKLDREHFVVMHVDSRCDITGVETVAIGSLGCARFQVSNVFKSAILNNAYGVIVCHNHPSGGVTPSDEDIYLTERLENAGKILGVKLLDHIIIGHNECYCSFGDEDLLND